MNPGANYLKKCSFCKRSNPAIAKFCGGCGRSTRFSVIESVSRLHNASTASAAGATAKCTASRRPIFKSLRQFVAKRRKLAATFLVALLIGLSGALYVTRPTEKPFDTVAWSDFRAFLSRKFEIPHYELDTIYQQVLAATPDESSGIHQEEIFKFESFFRESFNQPDLNLFPNPFFESAVKRSPVVETSSVQGFADIPSVHPVYAAIKPLLELGLKCSDSNNRIKPYEKMTWEDWQRITTDLMAILSLDRDFITRLTSGHSGAMSNIDLRNFLEHLRERLFIKSTAPLIYSREQFFPSRLESLAALANVIKELNEAK